jgi:hypothetical protein
MGDTFRQIDKKSNFRKIVRICEHVFVAGLFVFVIMVTSLVGVVGFSMNEGQESFVMFGIPFCIGLWILFLLLYNKWQLDWDFSHMGDSEI